MSPGLGGGVAQIHHRFGVSHTSGAIFEARNGGCRRNLICWNISDRGVQSQVGKKVLGLLGLVGSAEAQVFFFFCFWAFGALVWQLVSQICGPRCISGPKLLILVVGNVLVHVNVFDGPVQKSLLNISRCSKKFVRQIF